MFNPKLITKGNEKPKPTNIGLPPQQILAIADKEMLAAKQNTKQPVKSPPIREIFSAQLTNPYQS